MSTVKLNTAQSIIAHVVQIEGGFVDDAADSGGATRYGITEQVAREAGYQGSMSDLPKNTAVEIYRRNYWAELMLDDVLKTSPGVALELFDTAVNAGVSFAATSLQRVLNVLNRNGRDFPDLVVDGDIGPNTIAAYQDFLRTRSRYGETVLLRALNCVQGAHYIELSERRSKDERFTFGWLLNRVAIH